MANLTPEQLAQLQRLFSTPVEMGDTNAYMPEYAYNPADGRTYDRQDGGYLAYNFDPTTNFSRAQHESLFNGEGYDQYGNDGSYTGSGKFTGIADSNKALDFIKGAAIMAGGFGATMAGAGAAAGAGGAAGSGAGAGGMTNGAFLGEAPWTATGGGALDFGAGSSAAGAGAGGGAAGGGAYGAGSSAGMQGIAGSNAAFNGAVGGGSGLASVGAAAGAGAGSSLLGTAATIAGGLLGSQGQKQEASSTRDIPEWLKPYAQKILGYGGSLLDAQMQPGAMAGYDQMKTQGQSLLSQPVAGNGTSLFPARPTLMRR